MNAAQLMVEVQNLRDSSDFRHGDATAFDVCLLRHEAELPGKSNAKNYLEGVFRRLAISKPAGKRCAVVCAGNGGLVAELLMAGASGVFAIEPRDRYHSALRRVLALLGEVHEGAAIDSRMAWPAARGEYDLILWPEGLEECMHPAATMSVLASCLAPGGTCVVEVVHGSQGAPQPRLNSWRPSKAAWDAFFADTFGGGKYMVTHGRAVERCIYSVTLKGEGVRKADGPKLAKPAPLPAFPRSKETDELAEKAEQPAPVPESLPVFPKEPVVEVGKVAVAPPPAPEKAHLPAFPRDPAPKTVHRVGSTHVEEAKPAEKPAEKKPKRKRASKRSKKKSADNE